MFDVGFTQRYGSRSETLSKAAAKMGLTEAEAAKAVDMFREFREKFNIQGTQSGRVVCDESSPLSQSRSCHVEVAESLFDEN